MPLFHVSGTTWALQCMAVGGQTIVLRDIVPADVLDQLARDRISHAFFVPAVYQFFLSVPGVRGRDYSSLRCLGYGGSPMPLPLLRECRSGTASANVVAAACPQRATNAASDAAASRR
jgi:acyl-CoA synthetase (AMP-forming)/AMP-acid ligase II